MQPLKNKLGAAENQLNEVQLQLRQNQQFLQVQNMSPMQPSLSTSSPRVRSNTAAHAGIANGSPLTPPFLNTQQFTRPSSSSILALKAAQQQRTRSNTASPAASTPHAPLQGSSATRSPSSAADPAVDVWEGSPFGGSDSTKKKHARERSGTRHDWTNVPVIMNN